MIEIEVPLRRLCRLPSLGPVSLRVPLTFGSLAVSNDRLPRVVDVPRTLELDVTALASTPHGSEELARLLDIDPHSPFIAERVVEALSRGQLVYEDWTPTFGSANRLIDEVDLHDLAGDEVEELVEHSVVLELVDGDDVPVPRAAYQLIDPDGRTHEGRLDKDGRAEVEGIRKAGDCKVCFPEFDQAAWDYVSAFPL